MSNKAQNPNAKTDPLGIEELGFDLVFELCNLSLNLVI